ncbi:MAG: 2-amino-4-hydroxy-6-hydroxymethyldihydropteridine diphosphokinase [Candidatus Dadabacteria bacterium]
MAERIRNEAFLLIGGNMGDRLHYLREAIQKIKNSIGEITKTSSVYETAAWGIEDQAKFLNQVLVVHTSLSPKELLESILTIEEQMGRKREVKYGPRIIDIDILFYDDEVTRSEGLTIPHPEIPNRKFVLVPLAEINPGFIHPVINKTVLELLSLCTDKLDVYKFS